MHSPFFGIFYIAAGVLLCFFGHKLIGPTTCIIGFIVSVAIVVGIFYTIFMKPTTSPKTIYFVLGAGIILGAIAGWLLMKYPKVGAGMAAGVGGFFGGIIIYAILLASLPSFVKYILGAIGAGVAIWLSKKFYDPVIIGSTSAIGSYAIVIGLSTFFKHYYGISEVIHMMTSGQFS